MIVSETVFFWFNTFCILAMGVGWMVWDLRNLLRLWPLRKEHHDEFFGAIMGLVMVAIAFVGVLKYHAVL